jgi:7-cyano-7-deazaguanine synthase in queuosine biosynthesis
MELKEEVLKRVHEEVDKYNSKNVGVLFSGGRDSSILLKALSKKRNINVFAICISNGMQYYDDGGSDESIVGGQFQRIMLGHENNNVSIDFLDARKSFQKYVMREIENDFTYRNHSSLLVCVGCKVIMHIMACKFALDNKIDLIIDGFNGYQVDFPEQTKACMETIGGMYELYGINYSSPLYSILDKKEKVLKLMNDFGIFRKGEAKCMFAYSFSPGNSKEIKEYSERVLYKVAFSELCIGKRT